MQIKYLILHDKLMYRLVQFIVNSSVCVVCNGNMETFAKYETVV
jgi:hypothetical protein